VIDGTMYATNILQKQILFLVGSYREFSNPIDLMLTFSQPLYATAAVTKTIAEVEACNSLKVAAVFVSFCNPRR